MKHYEYGYIIAKENEIVSENDITKINQTVKENLSRYSKYNPEEHSLSAPLYANRIRTWEVLGEEPECEVLYIGEGIEYFSFSCTDKIKKIYIPSSVKEIRKSISSDSKISELNNIYFEVSETNPYYSSENGSLYTKDFSKLIHFHTGKELLNQNCNELGKNCGYVCSKENNELKNIKILRKRSCINMWDGEFKIPENVEVVDNDFLIYIKTNKVYIPSSVKIIGKLNKYCFTVSNDSKTFSSDKNGYLYTADGKTFLQGTAEDVLKINEGCEEVSLTYCDCETLYIPESVNKVCGNRECNMKYSVNQNNKSFSEYKDSLYSKDYSELIELYADSEMIHIHNNCSRIRAGAFGSDFMSRIYGHKIKKISCSEILKNDSELRKIMRYIV